MIGKQELDRVMGATAYDSSGDKIGNVDTVFVDDVTGEPTFALVNTGLFGTRSSFVPIQNATIDGDDLRVGYTKDKIKDAPNIDADGHLEPSDEAELYRYYGMDYDQSYGDTLRDDRDDVGRTGEPVTGGMTTDRNDHGTVGHDTSGPTTDDAMTRSEEELHVGKERREVGRARLRKHVVTEHVTKTVPVQREEVHIEREPITDGNVDRATDGPAISEEEHEVVLHEEQPVVEKQAVPKERVRLDKDVHTDEARVEDDVRKEEIDVAGLEESRDDTRR
ncbi:YsnF/AvaK domain-containing protein [Egicoccus sp. AB-alg6-2]|uniref:YsnF/AvaK domain-containing protein n=1 Tax=Egicoccus sp. AB-alg6-2 TaxID=3242692 RepID=UPI00359DC978